MTNEPHSQIVYKHTWTGQVNPQRTQNGSTAAHSQQNTAFKSKDSVTGTTKRGN